MCDGQTKTVTFLDPKRQGGVTGGKGYTYQQAYTVIQIPIWIQDPAFRSVLLEGATDVDVQFERHASQRIDGIQVKNHTVALAELRKVLSEFLALDLGSPDTFARFVVACPGLCSEGKAIKCAIEEYRGLTGTYNSCEHEIMKNTQLAIEEKSRNLGLPVDAEFLIEKVYFDCDLPPLASGSMEGDIFRGRLQGVELYKAASHAGLVSAFGDMVVLVQSHVRKTISRMLIESCHNSAIARAPGTAEEKAVTVCLHNWTAEKFKTPPDYTIDWTHDFDRSCRRVPSANAWASRLLPELAKLKQDIQESTDIRLIRLLGKACLSAGVAFGSTFTEAGGYVIEIEQRGQIWRSDAPPAKDYDSMVVEKAGNDSLTNDTVVIVNVSGDAGPQVAGYLEREGLRYRRIVAITPNVGASDHSVQAACQATALASQIKAAIRKARDSGPGAGITHLFLLSPQGVAVFLGQKLSAVGVVQCYEFQDGGYVLSCLLRT